MDPLTQPDFFNVRSLVSMPEMVEAGVHLGHKEGTRNDYMRRYIFGNRLGVDILDLEQTQELLGDALNVAAQIAFRKGIIMFVSRSRQTLPYVEQAAQAVGEYSHCRAFHVGDFTQATQLWGMEMRLPDLVIYFNINNNSLGLNPIVTECAKVNIPSIGIVDSNCDPRLISYPVPGNDDTPSAVRLYCRLFQEAIRRGKDLRKKYEATLAEQEKLAQQIAEQEKLAREKLASSGSDSEQKRVMDSAKWQ